MSAIWDAIDRVERVLQSSTARRARARGVNPDVTKLSFHPNAPKMVTVIVALALTLMGLSVSGAVSIGFVNDLIDQLGWTLSRNDGYWMLLGSPVLLILGSLLPGI